MQTVLRDGVEIVELAPGSVLKVVAINSGSYANLALSGKEGNVDFPYKGSGPGGSATAGPFALPVTIQVEVRGRVSLEVISPSVASSVLGYGNAIQGADKVTAPVQHLTSTAAISTTATIRIAPTGTFYTARVAWTNNGASGAAKLYVAANCGSDVEGLVASQSALQRDAQLTMGDALILASPTPITSLNFSADGSIVSATHRLVVTFGA